MAEESKGQEWVTLAQARDITKMDSGHINYYVNSGRIQRLEGNGPRSHRYYLPDLQAIAREWKPRKYEGSKKAVKDILTQTPRFVLATLEDVPGLYQLAAKSFPGTAKIEQRRAWMYAEAGMGEKGELARSPRGFYCVKHGELITAYCYLVAMPQDRVPDYLRTGTSTSIRPADVLPIEPGRPLDIIIGGIGTDPDLPQDRRSKDAAILLRGMRHDLARWGELGIQIRRAYAYSETPEGIVLCTKVGMQQWEPPRGRRCTFVLDIRSLPNSFLFHEYADTALLAINPPGHEREREPRPDRPGRAAQLATGGRNVLEENRPAGAITLAELADQVGVTRSTLNEQLAKWEAETPGQDRYIKIPHPSRPGETLRYFTPEQQTAFLTWREERKRR